MPIAKMVRTRQELFVCFYRTLVVHAETRRLLSITIRNFTFFTKDLLWINVFYWEILWTTLVLLEI